MRSFVLILVASSLALSNANAVANESPSQGDNSPTPAFRVQQKSKPPKEAPKTQDNPPFASGVPSTGTVISEVKPNPSENQSEDQTKWWRNVNWYGWAQFFVAIGGLYIIWRTLKAIERQAAANQAATVEARLSTELAMRTAELTLNEFIATHRPKLIVRRVFTKTLHGQGIPDLLGIECIVANTGDSEATIVEINTNLWIPNAQESLPANPPYGDSMSISSPLDGGISFPWTHPATSEQTMRYNHLSGFAEEGGDVGTCMYFFGYIMYKDRLNRHRRTAFCRRFDFTTQRFTVVKDPDYEYQD